MGLPHLSCPRYQFNRGINIFFPARACYPEIFLIFFFFFFSICQGCYPLSFEDPAPQQMSRNRAMQGNAAEREPDLDLSIGTGEAGPFLAVMHFHH
jgi:hypothetical protein